MIYDEILVRFGDLTLKGKNQKIFLNSLFKLMALKMEGLDVNPINRVPGLNIKAKKVVLIDENLKTEYIRQRVTRKMDKIIKFMLRILNDDDTTDDDTGLVLDEISRLKGIVINKYRDYLPMLEYKSLLTKLIIIEEESI